MLITRNKLYSETNQALLLFCEMSCNFSFYVYLMGHAVAQLVEALPFKPEVRGLDSRKCQWNFSLT
jgi:hypothetical protein